MDNVQETIPLGQLEGLHGRLSAMKEAGASDFEMGRAALQEAAEVRANAKKIDEIVESSHTPSTQERRQALFDHRNQRILDGGSGYSKFSKEADREQAALQAAEAAPAQSGLQQKATAETAQAQAEPHGTPTPNQEAAGADNQTSGTDLRLKTLESKAKALRKRGKADAYAANRIEREHGELIDLLGNGQYQEVADSIGMTGKYTATNKTELENALYDHSMKQLEHGPGFTDYMGAHKVMSTGAGIAVAGGALAAINSNGGRRSNAELYSSPF